MTCKQLIGYINTREEIRYFFHVCCYGFSQGRKSLYNTAVYVMKDFVFLQNQVIYTNLLIWTKAFIFLRDPVICTIQLCEIKAFLFLQDPVTCIILLYQTKLFFSWQVPFVHSFLFSFLHVVLSDFETYILPLPSVLQHLTNRLNNVQI